MTALKLTKNVESYFRRFILLLFLDFAFVMYFCTIFFVFFYPAMQQFAIDGQSIIQEESGILSGLSTSPLENVSGQLGDSRLIPLYERIMVWAFQFFSWIGVGAIFFSLAKLSAVQQRRTSLSEYKIFAIINAGFAVVLFIFMYFLLGAYASALVASSPALMQIVAVLSGGLMLFVLLIVRRYVLARLLKKNAFMKTYILSLLFFIIASILLLTITQPAYVCIIVLAGFNALRLWDPVYD